LTISGGEPLFQAEFTLEIARLVKEKNISCCIETCGFGSYDKLKKLLPYTDIFLFDYKVTDAGLHRKFTGQDNKLILENLRKLDADGARIILRCPLIGGMNDQLSHLHAIAQLAEELPHVEAVHVEPYHPMARGKYQALGLSFDGLPENFPDADTVEYYISTISANTSKPVLPA
jgi:pyruvate formate lyase activating enzyme